jgi:hypothetical protein
MRSASMARQNTPRPGVTLGEQLAAQTDKQKQLSKQQSSSHSRCVMMLPKTWCDFG